MNKKTNRFAGAGLLSAIAASLCCITPVLALVSGASGIASVFSWMEPIRPYLIGIAVLVLGFAWYQKLKPRTAQEIQCDCEEGKKKPFMQTKTFLGIVTVFASLMLAFPYYAHVFYPSNDKKEVVIYDASDMQIVIFDVKGMTCAACEKHVNHEINKLSGIIKSDASYNNEKVIVEFDSSITRIEEIEKAINATGYTLTNKHNK